jgi:hypothetical protein
MPSNERVRLHDGEASTPFGESQIPPADCIRPYDDQRPPPVLPRVAQQQPKQSISSLDGRSWVRALAHRQLLAERQVLKRDRAMFAADQRQGPKQPQPA